MKTVYVDITTLLAVPILTGIQRAVIETAVRLIAQQHNLNYQVILLRNNRDFNFSICDNNRFIEYYRLSKGNKRGCVTGRAITIDQLEADSFWLDMDSVWVLTTPRNLLYPQLAKRNIQIGTFVYDVITLTHPQFTSSENYMRFPPYIAAVLDYADYIFTEAEFTRGEIQKIAEAVGCTREIQYVVVPLGGDFFNPTVNIVDREAAAAPLVQEIGERGKILLTVSTLEIRKNHKVLLDAFDMELCEKGYQLVFVGKKGWKVDDLLERIERHPQNGKSLFHLQGISDSTLHYLYAHASFVLFPSYIEGYGLATVEALQNRVPTILSDVPIMREVGGEYCDYFDPDNPEQLIDIIGKYEIFPQKYDDKCKMLERYHVPTWNESIEPILKNILLARMSVERTHRVEQIVYLSARTNDLLDTLQYVEHFMPFLKKALIFCPESMAKEMTRLYTGRLALTYVTDSELLQREELPSDHTHRNFFLRCLAMRRPELEDEFIMSDDDYRPLERIDLDFYINENRYQAFYCYDLDEWRNVVGKPTSYDRSMMRTNMFLKSNGYPNLQYASHMPQIIRKEWYVDLLNEYPGIENTGLDEWSTYFNYVVKIHPESVAVRPYVTLAWPGNTSDWNTMVTPGRYVFENYYEHLYDDGKVFSGLSKVYNNSTYLENEEKKALFKALMLRAAMVERQWRDCENKYQERYRTFPSFVFCMKERAGKFVNPPKKLQLIRGGTYQLRIVIMEQAQSGEWRCSNKDVLFRCYKRYWDHSDVSGDYSNWDGSGYVIIPLTMPDVAGMIELELFYGIADDGDFDLACNIPVELK